MPPEDNQQPQFAPQPDGQPAVPVQGYPAQPAPGPLPVAPNPYSQEQYPAGQPPMPEPYAPAEPTVLSPVQPVAQPYMPAPQEQPAPQGFAPAPMQPPLDPAQVPQPVTQLAPASGGYKVIIWVLLVVALLAITTFAALILL